jgi:hypothetical protein
MLTSLNLSGIVGFKSSRELLLEVST